MYKYNHLISKNTAPVGAKKIGIYNSVGNRICGFSLGKLSLPVNESDRLYSFGAISDIHLNYQTGEDDFRKALTYFDQNEEIDFICICGDFHNNGTNAELALYKEYIDNYFTRKPVYAIPGNHENYPDGVAQGNIADRIKPYTGKDSYYCEYHGNDVFIMCGIHSNAAGSLFKSGQLQWLYNTLEANRNKRCFLFIHPRPDDGCGDVLGVYGNSLWGGTEKTVFESLVKHYSNCIIFHGHTHMAFDLQVYGDTANYDKQFGCHSVHISSLSSPREDTNGDGKWDHLYAESEGYVVDVYENGIHLRGRDFVKGEFLPIASYWLDTSLQTIEANTFTDSTGTVRTT